MLTVLTRSVTPSALLGIMMLSVAVGRANAQPVDLACCLPDGTCVIRMQMQCEALSGYPLSDPSCQAVVCVGACCASDGSCTLASMIVCNADGNTSFWAGPGSTCETARCSVACCRPDLTCTVTGAATCEYPNFTTDFTSCVPQACLPVPGACCTSGPSCSVTDACECFGLGGQWFPNQTCVSGSCPEQVLFGACCVSEPQQCAITSQDACIGILSIGQTCEAIGCVGSVLAPCCCRDICRLIEAIQCFSDSPPGTSCTPDLCGSTACCDAYTGACIVVPFPLLCNSIFFANVACQPHPCPPPITGACCNILTGICTMVGPASCEGANSAYFGDNEPCLPMICSGSCCLGPFYGGTGTVCATLLQPDCEAQGGFFRGLASVCDATTTAIACCAVNFNGVDGVTIQDLFDFVEAYFDQSPRGDFNLNNTVSVQDIFDFLGAYFSGCH